MKQNAQNRALLTSPTRGGDEKPSKLNGLGDAAYSFLDERGAVVKPLLLLDNLRLGLPSPWFQIEVELKKLLDGASVQRKFVWILVANVMYCLWCVYHRWRRC